MTLAEAIQARDDFQTHLANTLTPEQLFFTTDAADKLHDLVTKPGMLNVFALVNAELTVLHLEGNLLEQDIKLLVKP